VVGPWWLEVLSAVGPSAVVVLGVLVEDSVRVTLTEDQHLIGYLRSNGEHKPLCVGIRPWTSGRDLHGLGGRAGQNYVERLAELPSAVPHENLEVGHAVAEVDHEVAGLLHGPRSVGMVGDAEDVDVSGADFHREEHVQPFQRDGTVDVEEVDGGSPMFVDTLIIGS
jgi:hypothetical protein